MQWDVLSRVNLINGTTRQQERGNVTTEREKKKMGAIYLKAINHFRCHFFSWVTNKHASYFKLKFSAAVSATWMSEHDVKAVRTDLQYESSLRKSESVVRKN